MVIFDLDNTLYDYDMCDNIAEQKVESIAVEKMNISQDQFSGLYKQAKRDVKNKLGEVAASHNRFLYMQRFCELVESSPFDYAMELYNAYWDAVLKNMRLFPYVIPLFNSLRNGNIKIGILTDLTAQIQYRKIKQLGIEEYVGYIVTSEEVGEEKPSIKMFQSILQKSGFRIDEVLMIGDSQDRDIVGAKKAGIKAIMFKRQENFERIVENEIDNCSTLL